MLEKIRVRLRLRVVARVRVRVVLEEVGLLRVESRFRDDRY